MDKTSNLILAAFCFFLFVTGIAYCQMNKWVIGLTCFLTGLIGIIATYIADKRREKREEIKQDEINKVRIDQLIEEFSRSDYFVLKIIIGHTEMILNRIGFTTSRSGFVAAPDVFATADFVAWSDVKKISTFKNGGGSKSEPTPYYVLSIFLANNKLIWTKFKNATEHAKVVEAISQWLWKRQTLKEREPLPEIRKNELS
ncbi:MAG: hypothetical protein PHP95_17345 [Desulfuromonadaceae bacterium]|nr:hypothetical protein [Desulfuromonadaceae bacterium]MDD2850213.1 hypothetical protein [Desulfuromonadaceae bacterium]